MVWGPGVDDPGRSAFAQPPGQDGRELALGPAADVHADVTDWATAAATLTECTGLTLDMAVLPRRTLLDADPAVVRRRTKPTSGGLAFVQVTAVQSEYSLWWRRPWGA